VGQNDLLGKRLVATLELILNTILIRTRLCLGP